MKISNSLKSLVLITLASSVSLSAAPFEDMLNKKLASSPHNNYNHAYAPSITYENGTHHVLYCSSGTGIGDWDKLRHIKSSDGGVTWSDPKLVLEPTDAIDERATCDPNVLRYTKDGKYYMYYSGNQLDVQTLIFVARSNNIEGPYEKYIGNGKWSSASNAKPHAIIRPMVNHDDVPPEVPSWYGAGQSTAYMGADGKIHLWYMDDSANTKNAEARVYKVIGSTPVNFSEPIDVGVSAISMEVKYDLQNRRMVMAYFGNRHLGNSFMKVRYSYDVGKTWGQEYTVASKQRTVPSFSHNIGLESDFYGNLLNSSKTMVGFGSASDMSFLNPMKDPNWGRWDLYASNLNIKTADRDGQCTVNDFRAYATLNNSTAQSAIWSHTNLRDNNINSLYSSNYAPSENNPNGEFVATWFSEFENIDLIKLYPRKNGSSFMSFPKEYKVYVTNESNNAWVYKGTYNNQPVIDEFGVVFPAEINLKHNKKTIGILIAPTKLGVDDNNNHYFQLGEIKVQKKRKCN